MRFLVLLFALLPAAFAVNADDIYLNQRDPTNTFQITRFQVFPAASANGITVMNGTTRLPQVALFDGGLTFDGTYLTTSGIPQANVSGLTASLGAKASTSALATVAFTGNYADLSGAPSGPRAYDGTTLRTGALAFTTSAATSGGAGVVVFQLTSDGTSGGSALFVAGPIKSSINLIVNDNTASYPASWVWSNSDKTLTVTLNKASSTFIGLLGLSLLSAPAAAPNGVTVNLSVIGY